MDLQKLPRTSLRIPDIHDFSSDILHLRLKNKVVSLKFFDIVVHVCKVGEMSYTLKQKKVQSPGAVICGQQ